MKILLVEDNEMNRDMLSRRLIRRGFEVPMAVDGQLAIDMSVSESPDLILMDISLPIVNGCDESDRAEALAAGCDDYDTKPVDVTRLLEKINALLPGATQ